MKARPTPLSVPISIDALNRNFANTINEIVGDQIIAVNNMGSSVGLSLNVENLLCRIPKVKQAGGTQVIINAIGGFGAYTGTTWLAPTSDIPSSSNVTNALLGTAGVSCIILNPAEAGLSTNLLGLGTVHDANLLRTNSDGTPVYLIDVLPIGATGSPATLTAGSGTTADTASWTRNTDNKAVTVRGQTREYWDGSVTPGVLYYFTRDYTYDACGLLTSISYETQHTTDTTTNCP